MTKIIILNVGWSNKGNVAIVKSTKDTIKQFIEDAKFDFYGNECVNFYGLPIKQQPSMGLSIKKPIVTIESILYLIQCFFIGKFKKIGIDLKISDKSKLFYYYNADIIINSGGDTLSGENGIGSIGVFFNLLYGILLNKPVILYGESLGYFGTHFMDSLAKLVFERVKLILVREELSKKYLEKLGVSGKNIFLTADPAFLLKTASKTRVLEILKREGIDKIKNPLIIINPSGMIYKHIDVENQPRDLKLAEIIARSIDEIIVKLKTNIILIPHVYTLDYDDRVMINLIFEKINNKSRVKTIDGEYSPEELKGIINVADLFVGMRMHSMIAATSQYIPTVAIAYSHKTRGIIGKMLGMEEYVIDINDLDSETLISKVNEVYIKRAEIKKELELKIPKIKNKAIRNGQLVRHFYDSL